MSSLIRQMFLTYYQSCVVSNNIIISLNFKRYKLVF